MSDRYAYFHNKVLREYQIIDEQTGEVVASIDARACYPANAGMMRRYTRELNNGRH